jgi:hypothetical protein
MNFRKKRDRRAAIALAQGTFWFATGVWPILHLRSFERITGPKLEGWLVKTFGGLIAVVGGVLISASLRRRVTPEVALLGAAGAAALGAADVIYASKRRISPIYLADAALEAAIALQWGRARV